MEERNFKKPSDSETVKTEVVCPNDTNPMGMLKGGRLIEWMDIAAAGCAQIHSEKISVTAAINHADFIEAAKMGDIITINATITRVFNTSMEVFVKAFARSVESQRKYLIGEAYFTFVSIDEVGKPVKAIDVKPITTSEKKLYEHALYRREKIFEERNTEASIY